MIQAIKRNILALFAKGKNQARTANHVHKKYFLAIHEGLGRIVKEHNSQTGQNLDPKMALFRTKSSMIHEDLAKKSIRVQDNIFSLVRSNFVRLRVTLYFLNYNYNTI